MFRWIPYPPTRVPPASRGQASTCSNAPCLKHKSGITTLTSIATIRATKRHNSSLAKGGRRKKNDGKKKKKGASARLAIAIQGYGHGQCHRNDALSTGSALSHRSGDAVAPTQRAEKNHKQDVFLTLDTRAQADSDSTKSKTIPSAISSP